MAAQAASALKAVKANQNARAQDLLAKAEITGATPAKVNRKASPLIEPVTPEAGINTASDTTPVPARTEAKKAAKPKAPAGTKKK